MFIEGKLKTNCNLNGKISHQIFLLFKRILFFCFTVNDSQQNINVLRGLALQLQHIVYQENQKCWGKPLGSTNLWQEHVETIKRIQTVASQIEIKEVSGGNVLEWSGFCVGRQQQIDFMHYVSAELKKC